MKNLLKETENVLQILKKQPDDIIFIGSTKSGHSCTWKEFEQLSNFEYDYGYGAQEIATDLVIIFKDGSYLDRYEYDGAEEWNHHRTPKIPQQLLPIKCLGGGNYMWQTLEEINTEQE